MHVPVGDISEVVRDHRVGTGIAVGIIRRELLEVGLTLYPRDLGRIAVFLYSFEPDLVSLFDIFLDFRLTKTLVSLIGRREQ